MGARFLDILGSIVTVALVTTIVSHPESSNVVKAFGDTFAGAIRAAMGK